MHKAQHQMSTQRRKPRAKDDEPAAPLENPWSAIVYSQVEDHNIWPTKTDLALCFSKGNISIERYKVTDFNLGATSQFSS